MRTFCFRAVDGLGAVRRGRMAAGDERDLERRLSGAGLELLRCRSVRGVRRPSRRQLALAWGFVHQLLEAGITLPEALRELQATMADSSLAEVIEGMCCLLQEGRALSAAMADYPRVFDPLSIRLVQIGEQSGRLPEILQHLVSALGRQDRLLARMRTLLLYPVTAGLVVMSASLFLLLYLVPQLVSFLEGLGRELPLQTRLLIGVSTWLADHGLLMLLVLTVLGFGAGLAGRTAAGRVLIDRLLLRVWPVGRVLQRLCMSRFAASLALLYHAGIPVLEALRLVEAVVGNRAVAAAVNQARENIERGETLSAGFARTGLFPPLVLSMLQLGERSGGLDEALQRVHQLYKQDIDESIDRMQRLIEPALTVVLAFVLGWVVLAVLPPIYDALTAMGV